MWHRNKSWSFWGWAVTSSSLPRRKAARASQQPGPSCRAHRENPATRAVASQELCLGSEAAGGALEGLERKCALLMGPPKLRRNFPSWEAGSRSDPCDLSQKVLWNGRQATPVAICDISILSPRLEIRRQHLLHSNSFCSVGFSSRSSRESVSEIATSFSQQFFSFQAVMMCLIQVSFGKEW